MIINHKYEFIFIKTRKTGGTSVEIALSELSESLDDVLTPLVEEDEKIRFAISKMRPQNYKFNLLELASTPARIFRERNIYDRFERRALYLKFWNHISAPLVQSRTPESIWSYTKFTIERDPWDKIVSCYKWLLRYLNRSEANYSLTDFFNDGWADWLSDFHLYSKYGLPLLDYYLNYDKLTEATLALSKNLHLNNPIDISRQRINAKGDPRNNKTESSKLFDSSLDNRVRIIFSREITTFGFRTSVFKPKPNLGAFLKFGNIEGGCTSLD